MDLKIIFEFIKDYLPIPVIVSIVCVIFLTNVSKSLVTILENYLEEMYLKQLKFFDHKKIWLSLFWCIVMSVTLASAGFIQWSEFLYYMFVIMGASTFFYEAFLKKIGMNDEN